MPTSIFAIQSTTEVGSLIGTRLEPRPVVNEPTFNLIDHIESLDDKVTAAGEALLAYSLEKPGASVHEMVIAMEEARLSLQVAVEVRNKVAEAYREVTTMQI